MRCRKIRSFIRIKRAVKEIRRGFRNLISGKAKISNSLVDVGENLKEGYLSVLTIVNNELKKFQVALYYLRHPPFLKLLEAAAQEFGFDQPGSSSYRMKQVSSKEFFRDK